MADYTQMSFEDLESLMSAGSFDIIPTATELPEQAPLPEQGPEVSSILERPRITREAIQSRLRNTQKTEDLKSEIS